MFMKKSNRPFIRRTVLLMACCTALLLASCAAQEPTDAWQPPEKPVSEETRVAPPEEVAEPPVSERTPVDETPSVIEPTPGPADEEDAEQLDFKEFTFRNVRQYFVVNEKEGRILSVEGFVVNRSATARDFITVEASLFDADGQKIANKRSVGGVTVPVSQLESFSREDLESLLHDEVGIFMTNVNIAPGGEVPFMVLFYDPPENVREFGVKVVEAQETEADQGNAVRPAAGAVPETDGSGVVVQ
ncbi:hypothetical protein DPQ33_17615 [Oceanidesulfovibrio indonesiensis]|uniref:DUF4352 domain-containing protein n=2 Tax=Oceanidesulfovibrio indonesiensis TaxID=54767 RepID=A0A7M3MA61_9BACT|nr:hypothetical protein DPQ33_17615 [Oceanidesulfovibrio indonesiensis]